MAKIINQSEVTGDYVTPDTSVVNMRIKSNESHTENMTTSFVKTREVSKDFGHFGEEITQTITLKNESQYIIDEVRIIDEIGDGLIFLPNSVTVNDEAKENENPEIGFELENSIMPDEEVVIKYTIVIDNDYSKNSAEVKTHLTYSVNEVLDLEEDTNVNKIDIVNNFLTIVKTADTEFAVKGQTVTYLNEIQNKGGYKNTQVTFKDSLMDGLDFVEGSVIVDGTPEEGFDPTVGFSIKDLDVGDKSSISFDVKIL